MNMEAAGGTAPLEAEREDPDVLSDAELDALLAGAPWTRFAVMGDSIAEGVGEAATGYIDRPWADRLADALRRAQPALEYLNLGKRSLRSDQILDTQLERCLNAEPDLVALAGGGNDLLVAEFDPAPLEQALDAIVGAVTSTGATVAVLTLFDIGAAMDYPGLEQLRDRLELLAQTTRSVAQRHGSLLVDLRAEPVSADPGIYSSDFQHVNARGHAIAASVAARTLGLHLGNTTTDGRTR